MPSGKVKWFNAKKGYGFITDDETQKDIFLHVSALESSKLRVLKEEQTIVYDIKEEKNKLQAIPGNVPIPINFPEKCGFNDRCIEAIKGKCEKNIPALVEIEKGHKTRCFLHSNEIDLV